MKNIYLFIITIIILSRCQKDEKEILIPKNYLEEFQTEKVQFFDLDTLASKEINGKNGTKIYFNRSDFEVSQDEKITLELIELYDFNEVLYRNLSTVTTDNELLETNGVLYISFKSNDEELRLKKNKKILVYPPEGKLETYSVYNSVKDSLENNKWKISKQDSIKTYHFTQSEITEFLKRRDDFFTIENNNFGWINIDKIADIDYKLNFKLIDKKNQFSNFTIYFTYKNQNSFMTDIRLKDDLKFKNLTINGSTWLTVIGTKDNILFYDKLQLEKSLHNSEIILNMKKTTNKDLQKLLID